MRGVGGIGFNVDVIAVRPVRTVEEFDYAEALVNRVEERLVAAFAFAEIRFNA